MLKTSVQFFIAYAMRIGAIWFSATETMKLKSGRDSPYFFNSGGFSTGESLKVLAEAYADLLVQSRITFDVVFGPAYKGIPLAAAIAVMLSIKYDINVGWAANRKEAKGHGEGGTLLGAALSGKSVAIIDDVITDGGSKHEAYGFIEAHGGNPVLIAIAFNRKERGQDSERSAAARLNDALGIPVVSIADVGSLIEHIIDVGGDRDVVAAINRYQDEYGARD